MSAVDWTVWQHNELSKLISKCVITQIYQRDKYHHCCNLMYFSSVPHSGCNYEHKSNLFYHVGFIRIFTRDTFGLWVQEKNEIKKK